MRFLSPILAASLAACLIYPAWAQDKAKPAPAEASPHAEIKRQQVDDNGPPVEIEDKKNVVIEEYRVGGRLFKIKVIPKVGPPYYLVDERGDGKFTRMDGPDAENMRPPFWVLFRF